MRVSCLLVSTLLVLNHQYGNAYNLDVLYPHVYQSNMPGDYFGYSVALSPIISQDQPAWMMVGAPRGNRSEVQGIYQPGRVLICQFNQTCVPQQLDYMDPYSEHISTSMLGASQDILNGRFISCAPRWMGKRNEYNTKHNIITMLGAAYWGTSNDIKAIETEKLTPLDDPTYYTREYYTSDRRLTPFPIYVYGEAGFSSHFPNITKGHKELVLGAPGAYNWQGSTILYRDVTSNEGLARRKRGIGLGDFQEGPIVIDSFKSSNTKSFGLFGYTVSSGRYFSRTYLLHVAGAPRAEQNGQVLLYSFPDQTRESLKFAGELRGDQPGEYFGAALASGDINGDGLDDLVIGAPLYSSIKDEGRVLIYFGKMQRKLVKAQGNGEIIGTVQEGRFGSTISLIDLDYDGHQDVVIAAPYEGDGVVYIYSGNDIGVSERPTQRISGSKVAPGSKSFGYSLSRGQDVDGNGYNDLAIGAYKSGHAVILRSRPVIKFEVELRPQLFGGLPRDSTSFQLERCVKYFGYNAPQQIVVIQSFDLDPRLKRISQNGRDGNIESQVKLFATTPIDNFNCETLTISVKRDIFNFLEPIPITLEYKLLTENQEYKPVLFQGPNKAQDNFCSLCPVMLPNYKAIATTQILFATECKSEVCESQLFTNVEYIGLESNNFIVGKTKSLTVRVSITNDDQSDPAYWTRALISLPVHTTRLPLNCQEAPKENKHEIVTSLICEIANPLKPGNTHHVDLELDMGDVSATQGQMRVTAKALTSNNLISDEDIETSAVLGLVAHADTFVSGKPGKEFFLFDPKNSKEKSPKTNITFNVQYQVEKFGPSPVDVIRLTVKIPIALKTGERFLYLIEDPDFSLSGKPMDCTSEMLLRNNAQPPNTIKAREQRRKRDVKNAITNEKMNEYPSNRTMYVNCTNNDNWVCAEVSCLAGSFSKNRDVAKLSLTMVINTPVLETFLGKRDIILLGTEASVYVVDPPIFQQYSPNLPDIAYVNAVFMGPPTEGEVQPWVIALSIIAGILLLLALVTGLVKAGFFERKDKDALTQLKQETEAEGHADNPITVTDES